jgi:mRNA interferase RelE/StbE
MLNRINTRIKSLAQNPYERGTKKLAGSSRFRVAVGAYRIIYRIDDGSKVVSILSVLHRREAYR